MSRDQHYAISLVAVLAMLVAVKWWLSDGGLAATIASVICCVVGLVNFLAGEDEGLL